MGAPRTSPIQRVPTGIRGLDEMLGGGVPAARALLVTGGPGTGKTVFLNEFVYRGITQFDEGAVIVTFEETPDQIAANVASFGWDYEPLIRDHRLAFVDVSPSEFAVTESGEYEWFTALLARVRHAVAVTGAKRVVIDSISSLFGRYERGTDPHTVRTALFLLTSELKREGITVALTAEQTVAASNVSRFGVEEFVADGVIELGSRFGENRVVRVLTISKLRGVGYRSGQVEMEIGDRGLEVFPKLPVDTSYARTDFAVRFSTGVDGLDEAMGGGIPQGHMTLVGGNTGTGKTLLGLHFLAAGCAAGEAGIWVALEEPVPQVVKTAAAHGWDLASWVEDGLLTFVSASLLDISPDRLLSDILAAAEKTGAKRVVLDSVSSLESSVLDAGKVRQLLIQAAGYFKTRGISCVMTYLTAESFSASGGQLLGTLATNEMRLSSIVDAILIQRYVERGGAVERVLNILKVRGSDHLKHILRYEIADRGIVLGARLIPEETG